MTMENETFSKEYVDVLTQEIENRRRYIEKYRRVLKDAVNELCYQCGQYKQEHKGACDGCRWKGLRSSDIE